MKPPLPLHTLRWPAIAVVCTLAGIPIGKSLRHALFPAQSSASGVSHQTPANPAFHTDPVSSTAASAVSEETLEKEMSRLLGAPSENTAPKTTEEKLNALTLACAEKSDAQRFLKIYDAVNELRPSEIAAALEQARANREPIAVNALERRWAETDPAGAAQLWFEKKQELGTAFFSAWARSNPSSALRWYSSLPDGEQKQQARGLLVDQVAKLDPQRAVDFANQMTDGPERNQLISRALQAISEKDSASAIAVAKTLTSDSARLAALNSVISQIASKDPVQAQQLLAEFPPNTLSNAAERIATKLTTSDPQKAAEWADSLPEGQSKEAAYAGIGREWAARNVEEAAKWLDGLPQGAARNSAVAGFAARTAFRDPEGSAAWALTLPAGEQRESTLSRTVGVWKRMNPTAADDWINNSPDLSPAEKAALNQVQPFTPNAQQFRQFNQTNQSRISQ